MPSVHGAAFELKSAASRISYAAAALSPPAGDHRPAPRLHGEPHRHLSFRPARSRHLRSRPVRQSAPHVARHAALGDSHRAPRRARLALQQRQRVAPQRPAPAGVPLLRLRPDGRRGDGGNGEELDHSAAAARVRGELHATVQSFVSNVRRSEEF